MEHPGAHPGPLWAQPLAQTGKRSPPRGPSSEHGTQEGSRHSGSTRWARGLWHSPPAICHLPPPARGRAGARGGRGTWHPPTPQPALSSASETPQNKGVGREPTCRVLRGRGLRAHRPSLSPGDGLAAPFLEFLALAPSEPQGWGSSLRIGVHAGCWVLSHPVQPHFGCCFCWAGSKEAGAAPSSKYKGIYFMGTRERQHLVCVGLFPVIGLYIQSFGRGRGGQRVLLGPPQHRGGRLPAGTPPPCPRAVGARAPGPRASVS